jgi:hypothetical protein
VRQLADSLAQHPWAWLAIVALGAYHGLNPAMGWLFAVSNGMQERRPGAVFRALPPIALGHFLAMAAALLPFALLGVYLDRLNEIRIAAGVLLVALGVAKLVWQRHPRFLARIGPSHLTLWSFMMATAHGAGLMLVPAVLGLCGGSGTDGRGHEALRQIAGEDAGLTLAAATTHTVTMVLAGGFIAWMVYRFIGLRFLRRSWFNLDLLWAVLLIVAGVVALALAL